jgi:hypothetical protein
MTLVPGLAEVLCDLTGSVPESIAQAVAIRFPPAAADDFQP